MILYYSSKTLQLFVNLDASKKFGFGVYVYYVSNLLEDSKELG